MTKGGRPTYRNGASRDDARAGRAAMAQRRRWAADEGVRELSERDRRHARRKERNHHHHHYCGGDERASEPSRFDLMAMAGARAGAGAGAPLPPKFKSEMTIFRPAAQTNFSSHQTTSWDNLWHPFDRGCAWRLGLASDGAAAAGLDNDGAGGGAERRHAPRRSERRGDALYCCTAVLVCCTASALGWY